MRKHMLPLIAVLLVLVGCADQPDLPTILTATPAPPTTPAPRALHPTGEPGSARIHEPGWSTPIKLSFNDDGWEDSPYITRDGSQILFFYHPFPDLVTTVDELTEYVVAHPQEAEAQGLDGKIYVSDRPFTSRRVHPISQDGSPALECCPYVSPSGELFYVSNRRSWELMKDVPVSIYRDGERLDLRTDQAVDNPHYCPARDELWFDCPSDANLCVMRNAAATGFQGQVTVAPYPVNARDDRVQDSQAFLTDDCQTLYITSSRDFPDLGRTQIYRLRRLDEEGLQWSGPELFINSETLVAEVSMTADGTELVFAQVFWREDGTPGIDIYYSRKVTSP
ncbi:MAG: hypothetical protein Q9O62_08515 [Ardenticatenia bacterium]|nr:hypothetical protein [Ardenticatenia bacterium]